MHERMGKSFQPRAGSSNRGRAYATIAWRWGSTNGNGMEVKETGSFRGRLALAGGAFNLLFEESPHALFHLGGDILAR